MGPFVRDLMEGVVPQLFSNLDAFHGHGRILSVGVTLTIEFDSLRRFKKRIFLKK